MIRRIMMCVFVCSCTLYGQHQTDKGSCSIAGRISFTNINIEDASMTVFEFTPQLSLFMRDGFESGLSVAAQTTSLANSPSQSSIGIGPFVNWYLTDNDIKPFIGASYLYTSASSGGPHYRIHMYAGNAGVSIPVNQHVALQPTVQFMYYKNPASRTVFQTMIGISLKAFI